MYGHTLTWTPGNVLIQFLSRSRNVWEKQESRRLMGGTLSEPKNVENEHFYLILLTKNFRVIGLQFWDGRPCADTP